VSRWSRHCTFVATPSLDGFALIETLLALSRRIGKPSILIMTDDRAVETVNRYRQELEGAFIFNLPAQEMVEQLLDKAHFQRFAEDKGLPVPRTAILHGSRDLPRLEALRMPVVIKPADKRHVLNGRVTRAQRLDTVAQARECAKRTLGLAGSLVAQEWIEGPDTDLFFTLFSCDSRGTVQAIFTGRKLVCDPPGVGNTALCIAADDEAPALEAITRAFIDATGFRGLGSVEFKRDARTGEFLIIEPTVGRTDWQEELATLCGINIPLTEYRSLLGLALEPARQPAGPVAWRSSRRHRAAPGLLPPGTRVRGGHFKADDPAPAIFHYGYERFAGRALRLARRIKRGELHASV
jgi:predicted ATP-grasp superfamily ATP-dependent carboligase